MTEETAVMEQTESRERGRRQRKTGVVVSSKMDRTIIVAVKNTITDRLYHRYMKRTVKFYAHDEENVCGEGDTVEIVSSRPLSKLKRWRLARVVKRAEGS